MKSPQRQEKRKKKNKLGRPQRTVRKTKAADRAKWCASWIEWATNQNRHHRASGQLQTTGAHNKSVDARECLDNRTHFRKRSPHRKKSHGRSTQVSLCHLFGHVCDVCWSMCFHCACFLFIILGGLRGSTLAMAYARRARVLDHCSILSMQKRYRQTIRFMRNSTGPFWFGPMQLSDFSTLEQNVCFVFFVCQKACVEVTYLTTVR